jgi:transposase-like protein
MPTHKSNDYKLTAVQYYLVEDKTQEEVCKIFKCTPRSLMRWVSQYKNEGNVNIHYRKPVAYKVKKEYVKLLVDEINKNKTITLHELNQKLKDKYKDANLSTTQIFRVINDNNITLKLTRIRHEPVKRFGKDININSKIKEFYDEVKKYKIEDIICIDETSIKSLQKRNRCYSNKGKRCVIKTQSQEVFKKYTGVFAISVNGVVNWDLYEKGGINTDRLIEFLEHNITSKLRNKLIILDNASAHRNERIKALVNKHNNLLYAVPYQHFTNSIENYFSMLKSRLQKLDGLKYENLKENIQKVISEIPKEKYENIFKGAYERPEKYVPKNKTRKIKKNYK